MGGEAGGESVQITLNIFELVLNVSIIIMLMTW